MDAVRHIFDPELDSKWISSVENALDGIMRVGIWECETELETTIGWGYNNLDTFKRRIRCSPFDVDSIQEFDLMTNTFDGVMVKQSISDRANSSFYDSPTPNSLSNARLVASSHLQPMMTQMDYTYSYRPDLSLRTKSPDRWWTLYRKYAAYTIKYAFGGTKHSGWWTPRDHDWDTYPLGITRSSSLANYDANFVFDGPPYIQRAEFSVQWFKYRYSFDWPLVLDSGCRLDNSSSKWMQFYSVTTGYDKFNTVENLTKYDPFLGEDAYLDDSKFCFRYNVQENIEFGEVSKSIQIYSDCLDGYVQVGKAINLWAVLNWCGVSKPVGEDISWSAVSGLIVNNGRSISYTPTHTGLLRIKAYNSNLSAIYVVNAVANLGAFTPSTGVLTPVENYPFTQEVDADGNLLPGIDSGLFDSNDFANNTDNRIQERVRYGAVNPQINSEVVILSGRLDVRSEYKPIDLEVFSTTISEFSVSFSPRLEVSIETNPVVPGWGDTWGQQAFGG
jgi:hypothetical protein